MRIAELVMAIAMGLFSIYLMHKSAELPIGWIPDEGPGGGAFPFWLSAGMLVCCIWIIVNWVRRSSPSSRSEDVYFDRQGLALFLLNAGSVTAMVAAVQFISVYGAVLLFLIFYLRVYARHSWALSLSVAVATPIAAFFFFDIALRITLPKGLPWVEETFFYPLYDWFL